MGGKGSGRKKTSPPKPMARPKGRSATVLRGFIAAFDAAAERVRGSRWPAKQWQKDPVGFVREVLGGHPLAHQKEILRACVDRDARVAVRSGQKTGKTKLVIWLALWCYCCFPEANVCMTANSKEQVERVLWRELQLTIRHARKRGFEIEEPATNPATGLKSVDGRVIRGITVREKEAMAGISGGALTFIVDEASALVEDIAGAIEGNLAGGGRMVWISNPTRTEGPFFDAFHRQKDFWKTYHLSSEEVAKRLDAKGFKPPPGVATLSVIREWESKYGRESPFFIVRALGEFLRNETGKIISLDTVESARGRWSAVREDGPLTVGIDPAGPGDAGDEFAFAIVRGAKLLALRTFHGLSEDSAIENLRGFLKQYRTGEEIPRVIIDSEGPIGSALYGRLKAIGENLKRHRPADSFEVYGVKSSHYARREPALYERVREELWANLAAWLKTGAIPDDYKLETELNAPNWISNVKGQLKVTPKPELREKIGRSPDRADALCLAVWEPAPWLDERVRGNPDELSEDEAWGARGHEAPTGAAGIDPYGGGDPYGGQIDPYSR